LRIKGFSKSETLAEIVALDVGVVDTHLQELQAEEMAMFREARSLWQLTPAGRAAHPEALAKDLAGVDLNALKPHYHSFLEINDTFKHLCGDWQLRDGAPNDHSDDKYDQEIIKRLVTLHTAAAPVVSSMATIIPRLSPYVPRLNVQVGCGWRKQYVHGRDVRFVPRCLDGTSRRSHFVARY
jgi:hypothetical protein